MTQLADDLHDYLSEFLEGYQASFDDYVSLYCEEEAKAHAMERREELTGAGIMTQI